MTLRAVSGGRLRLGDSSGLAFPSDMLYTLPLVLGFSNLFRGEARMNIM